MKTAKQHTPLTWQLDPNQLETEQVQVWGETMRGLVPLETAREMVSRGSHFVMTGQAIGAIDSDS